MPYSLIRHRWRLQYADTPVGDASCIFSYPSSRPNIWLCLKTKRVRNHLVIRRLTTAFSNLLGSPNWECLHRQDSLFIFDVGLLILGGLRAFRASTPSLGAGMCAGVAPKVARHRSCLPPSCSCALASSIPPANLLEGLTPHFDLNLHLSWPHGFTHFASPQTPECFHLNQYTPALKSAAIKFRLSGPFVRIPRWVRIIAFRGGWNPHRNRIGLRCIYNEP